MNLIIAGGGTGGHLFPGIAVAEALMAQNKDAKVLFVGTERGIESREVPKAGFELSLIEVGGLKRVGIKKLVKTLFALPASILQSRRIVKDFKADAVIGVGGYASGPVVLAAALMGIPTAICEQNSVPGLTNKILAKFVTRIFASFSSSSSYFSKKKFRLVGNPVRNTFLEAANQERADVENDLVFIFGGSQGARPLNEQLPKVLADVKAKGVSLRVIHQAGKNDVDKVKARYQEQGIDAEVTPFIDDMVSVYQKARVVICRAGATSCAEVAALGVVPVLIPFPSATDDHQTLNAKDHEATGAAVLLPQSDIASRGAGVIAELMTDDAAWQTMSEQSKALGKLEAGALIARAAQNGFKEQKA